MDKLTELLTEAKPLYIRRKKTKQCICAMVILLIPVFAFTNILNLYNCGNDVYLSLNNSDLKEELLFDSMNLLR